MADPSASASGGPPPVLPPAPGPQDPLEKRYSDELANTLAVTPGEWSHLVATFRASNGIRNPGSLFANGGWALKDALACCETTMVNMQIHINDLMNEAHDLNTRLSEAREARPSGTSTRRVTDNPPKFNGEEKDITKRQLTFLAFWSQLKRCWSVDLATFELPAPDNLGPCAHFRRLSHIPGLLEGQAASLYRDSFDTITDNPQDPTKWVWTTVEACYTTLAAVYVTQDLALTARRDFDNLFMKNLAFPQFNSELATLGARCGKTDEQLVDALRLKISKELADQLTLQTDRPANSDYRAWVTLLQKLCNNLEESKHFTKIRNAYVYQPANSNKNQNQSQHRQTNQNHQQSAQNTAQTLPAGDPMDLSRLDLAPDQCAYCKERGHFKDACPSRPGNSNYNPALAARGRGRGQDRGRGFQSRGGYSGRGYQGRGRGGYSGPPSTYSGAVVPYNGSQYQQPYYGNQTQQRFNNQYGTGPQVRQVSVPNPGTAYSISESGGPSAPSSPTEQHPPESQPGQPPARSVPSPSADPWSGWSENA